MGSVGPLGGTIAGNDAGVGTVAWSTPLNALLDDASMASTTLLITEVSRYLSVTGFNMGILGDCAILGIAADIKRSANLLSGVQDNAVKLLKAGSPIGNNYAIAGAWPTSAAFQSYGGAADMWGTTWTPAEVSAAGFGLAISVTALLGIIASVDYVRLTVTYQSSNRIRSAHGYVSGLTAEIH